MKALAVFHDHGGHILDRWLKPGFRHVFCALASGEFWIRIDAQAGCPVIEPVAEAGYDLATFYRAEGFTVIETEQRTIPLRWPLMVVNCVGLVKMVLCIKAPLAVTPWLLYRLLSRGALLPGNSFFNPPKPLAQAAVARWRASGSPPSSGGLFGLVQRNIIRIADSPNSAGSADPASSASTPAPTPTSSGATPPQRKLRRGRSARLVGDNETAGLLGRPTAKLGG